MGKIGSGVGKHIREVNRRIHGNAGLTDDVGELNGPQDDRYIIALAFQRYDSAHSTAGGKDNFSELEFADVRRVGVEGPGHAIGGDGADGLVALLHQDNVGLVFDGRIMLGSDPEFALAIGERVQVDRLQDGGVRMIPQIENIRHGSVAAGKAAELWVASPAGFAGFRQPMARPIKRKHTAVIIKPATPALLRLCSTRLFMDPAFLRVMKHRNLRAPFDVWQGEPYLRG